MTTNDVISIIKACREAGVNKFELDGLKLDLQPTGGKPDVVEEKKNFEEREIRLKEEELENLRLTDPLAYETLIQYDLHNQG